MTGLDGVRAKLDRASHHAIDLKTRMDAAVAPGSYAFERLLDDTGTKYIYKVTKLPVIDPVWSLIFGDFLTNLRASLDHLAWQLVLLDGGSPNEFTQFPIHERTTNRRGNARPTRIAGVTNADVIKAVEAVQPWAMLNAEEGDLARDSALNMLNVLVNNDKHKLLVPIAGGIDLSRTVWQTPSKDATVQLSIQVVPLEVGDTIATFTFTGWDPPADFDPQIGVEIRLNDGPKGIGVWNRPMESVLRWLYFNVDSMVVSAQFARFFGEGYRDATNVFIPR
jgi:hypothetical protein